MKYLFFILFTGIFINAKSQSVFSLSDSVFTEEASLTSYRVMFDFDKPVLKQESFVFLDSVAIFMNDHPNLKFEIQNHTDSRARVTYSTNLTQRRAETVVDYLISKGIEKERLVAKGYFNKKLLISDEKIKSMKVKGEKEDAHRKNRRTVFVITGI